MPQARGIFGRMRAASMAAVVVLSCATFADSPASAQTYATGAILTTEEEVALLPEAPRARGFLPVSVDLGPRFPPVGNQGQVGSCVAWAVGYAALGYLMNEGVGKPLTRPDLPSPAYIYGLATRRSIEFRDDDCNAGSNILTTLRILASGTALEREFPYSQSSCPRPPDALVARVEARRSPEVISHGVITRSRRDGSDAYLDAVKQELARGYPVVTGLFLNEMFYTLGNRIWNGTVNLNKSSGHAITLTGYDEVTRSFSFINSWGTDWGNRGFGRLSYETLLAQNAIMETMRVAGITPRPADPAFPPEVIGLTLPKLECSSLDVADGAIRGYVASAFDFETLRRAVGTRPLRLEVAVRPWPQCEVLATLEPQLVLPDAPLLSVSSANPHAGQNLTVAATTAGYDGFLHLAYFQADGSVVHLVQPQPLALRQIAAGSQLIFGDGVDGRARFTVQAPFGPEMVLAIQSASPLFPEPRPRSEEARSFLTALRAAMLAQPFADRRPRIVTAAILALETKESP